MRVQHVEGEYRVVLTAEAMEALHLTEGSVVDVRSADVDVNEPVDIRYLSVTEALQAFRETLPQHREAYRELAK